MPTWVERSEKRLGIWAHALMMPSRPNAYSVRPSTESALGDLKQREAEHITPFQVGVKKIGRDSAHAVAPQPDPGGK